MVSMYLVFSVVHLRYEIYEFLISCFQHHKSIFRLVFIDVDPMAYVPVQVSARQVSVTQASVVQTSESQAHVGEASVSQDPVQDDEALLEVSDADYVFIFSDREEHIHMANSINIGVIGPMTSTQNANESIVFSIPVKPENSPETQEG
jgi:hypothetical protein